jgi:hypothetical protein
MALFCCLPEIVVSRRETEINFLTSFALWRSDGDVSEVQRPQIVFCIGASLMRSLLEMQIRLSQILPDGSKSCHYSWIFLKYSWSMIVYIPNGIQRSRIFDHYRLLEVLQSKFNVLVTTISKQVHQS